MKKQLNIRWDVRDATGYLFSFAKSLSCAIKHSPWREFAEDIVATSGFAFRMWVSHDLCPSATSIWEFDRQKPWVENGGLVCNYVGRCWGEDQIEETRRLQALEAIKTSVDAGVPAVVWDIGIPEWGLVTGYDDESQLFFVLPVNANAPQLMPFDALGKGEIPILSVLTVTGTTEKPQEAILRHTMRLAVQHLTGQEWCDNEKGLAAYDALIRVFSERPESTAFWNAEYFLGTHGALKEYAWKYFERCGENVLAELYRAVFDDWMRAFELLRTGGENVAADIVKLLQTAHENESLAVEIMQRCIA
ncbi:MAG: hypothetical protein ACOYIR_08895 [Christensenellales bacterium]|jgi:hypothetical protein